MTKLSDVMLRDDRASQPLATDVPAGTQYYVTDELVTEQSNGTIWEDVSDAGAGATGAAGGQLTGTYPNPSVASSHSGSTHAATQAAAESTAAGALSTHAAASDPHPGYTTAAELVAYAQPLDSDLTAIAALTTTSYGRALLALADGAALRTAGGVVIGTDVQAYDADIPTVSASQPEMEAGTEAALRSMSPLRVAQAIAALAAGGGASLTVEEVDGSPTDSAVTKIKFPNGTLAIASHVATYTPAAGGSGPYLETIALDGTYGTEFDEASLPAARTRPSGLVVGDETYQSAGGSYLRVAVASTGGAADKAYYEASAPAGDCEIVLALSYVSSSESDMIGPGIADSSGNGVAAIIYQGSLRTIAIASGHYSSLQGTLSISSYLGWGTPMWIKLRRSGNNWYASISLDGYNFGLETGAYSSAVTAARRYYGCYWSTEAGMMALGRLNKVA